MLPAVFAIAACTATESVPEADSASDRVPPDCTTPAAPNETPQNALTFDGNPPTNILFIVVDTLRKDSLSWYGSVRQTTPCLATKAEHIVRFNDAWAAGPWTGSATASLATGMWPEHHRFLRISGESGVPVVDQPIQTPPIAEFLQSEGWWTGLVSGNAWVGPDAGYSSGFTRVNPNAGDYGHTESASIGPMVNAWLDEIPTETPFFFHVQFLDNHFPYLPPEEFRDEFISTAGFPWEVSADGENAAIAEFGTASQDTRAQTIEWLRGLYDAETLSEDLWIARILQHLENQGRLDDTLVVVTADHGESIGDANTAWFGHGGTLRGELVEIPFLVYHPRLHAGVISGIVRGVDVVPTLLAAIEAPIPPGIDGSPVANDDRFAYGLRFPSDDGALRLEEAYAARDGVKVVRDCTKLTDVAYDLERDPAELAAILDVADVSGAATLRDSLDSQMRQLQSSEPNFVPCFTP